MVLDDLWPEPAKPRVKRRSGEVALGKTSGTKPVPVVLSKDACCWILKIGSKSVFPTKLRDVFEILVHEEVNLDNVSDSPSLLEEFKRVEQRIREMADKIEMPK